MSFQVKARVVEDALPGEVFDRLGLPESIRVLRDHAIAFSWTLDKDGVGIAVARSATRASLDSQVGSLFGLADQGRRLRRLIVVANTCGSRRFHERPDLLEVAEAIESGWCRFVAFTSADRISREGDAQMLFAEYLLENDVELVLATQGAGAVDLEELSLIAKLMSLPGAPEAWRRRRPFGSSRRDKQSGSADEP